MFEERADRYQIVKELSRGAVGIVYEAVDRKHSRPVALKVLDTKKDLSKIDLDRFVREIKVAITLDHPGIVKVLDFGTLHGAPFYAMELVRGPTLHAFALGRRPEIEWSLATVRDVAHALHHAHEMGIIHRDLKPNNVLLDPMGGPKIVDFGLAKRLDSARAITATEDVLGTPWYMAPEQFAAAAEVDRRADIYSLGVILYELLTGARPFGGKGAVEIARAMIKGDPTPPRVHRPDLPAGVETICLVALQRDPAWRYQTARAMALDLERAIAGRPVEAKLPSPIDRLSRLMEERPLVAALAVVGGALLLLGLGYLLLHL